MAQPLLSVIIPVYNVAPYLDRCIQSVVLQTYRTLEIILVDDGSTDNSPEICEQWVKKDPRIRVIHKANAGLGFARNTGMDAATGDFVAFVDSDDYLAENAYQVVLEQLTKTKAEAAYFGHYDVWGEKIVPCGQAPAKNIITSDELATFTAQIIAPEATSTEEAFSGVSVWGAVYRNDFLKERQLHFFSEREVVSEDIFFNVMCCFEATEIVLISEYLYYYVHRTDSLSYTHRDDRWTRSVGMVGQLSEIVRNYSNAPIYFERLDRLLLINLLMCLKQEIRIVTQTGWKKAYSFIKECCYSLPVKVVLSRYPIGKMPFKQRMLFGSIKHHLLLVTIALVKVKLWSERF